MAEAARIIVGGKSESIEEKCPMSNSTLEERVAALERQMAALVVDPTHRSDKDWRRIRGMFTGDDLVQQIFAEGRKIREAERKQSRSSSGSKRTRS